MKSLLVKYAWFLGFTVVTGLVVRPLVNSTADKVGLPQLKGLV